MSLFDISSYIVYAFSSGFVIGYFLSVVIALFRSFDQN